MEQGKRLILLDRDNTIVPRDTKVIPDDTLQWIRDVQAAGIDVALISNNWKRSVVTSDEELGTWSIAPALKPLPISFLRAVRKAGVKRSEALVVGDQVFTDILGAKLAGIDVVLVLPQTEVDLQHTLALRNLEAYVLRDMVPEGRE